MALKIADDEGFLDLHDALDNQENWGIEKAIQVQIPGSIRVVHKAKFATLCCDWCNYAKERQYFWVLENSFESNYPSTCFCIPYVILMILKPRYVNTILTSLANAL